MKLAREILKEMHGGYDHAPSSKGGVEVSEVVFDQINRYLDPVWVPIPHSVISRTVSAYHICSVDNYVYMSDHEGKFKISASQHPNVERLKTGIKGIDSGGGVLVKIEGKTDAIFDRDQSTVVSCGLRWIMLNRVPNVPEVVIRAVRDLREIYLGRIIQEYGPDVPFATWSGADDSIQQIVSKAGTKTSWCYTVGGFWNRNANTPDYLLDEYVKDLSEVIQSHAKELEPCLFSNGGNKGKRAVHDEVVFSMGWKMTSVTPTTAEARKALINLGVPIERVPFTKLARNFKW